MPRLLKSEREQLILEIAAHSNSQREELEKAKNWPQLSRYIGLIGLRGIIEAPWLEPHEVNHVKKMAAYEAISTPELKRRPPKAAEFWQDIEEQIGPELDEVKNLLESRNIPRAYQQAKKDLAEVKRLLANPLTIALRQSIREAG